MKATFIASIVLVFATGFLAWKFGVPSVSPKKENRSADLPLVAAPPPARDNTRIQVAILLDTSNSMDGLIDQAKSRLWNIINTLTTLKYQGNTPTIEIALYEYGNDGLSATSGHIRQVASLTTDLDLISEKLFSLSTNGGEEYCGAVITSAVNSLEWGRNEADMKLIYIAGNEPFNQGRISYASAADAALGKNIFINTIFCGNYREGISTKWKDGADKGKGKYFNIDSDRKVEFVETPYDSEIAICNTRMNDTYIGYGKDGASKKSNQAMQDVNAESVSRANSIERYVSKSKAAYKNESWDLVGRSKKDASVLKTIDKKDLPQEYQHYTTTQLEKVVAVKSRERDSIQHVIGALGKKRQAYIDEKMKLSGKADDLGSAINQSIIQFAATKGYTAEK